MLLCSWPLNNFIHAGKRKKFHRSAMPRWFLRKHSQLKLSPGRWTNSFSLGSTEKPINLLCHIGPSLNLHKEKVSYANGSETVLSYYAIGLLYRRHKEKMLHPFALRKTPWEPPLPPELSGAIPYSPTTVAPISSNATHPTQNSKIPITSTSRDAHDHWSKTAKVQSIIADYACNSLYTGITEPKPLDHAYSSPKG